MNLSVIRMDIMAEPALNILSLSTILAGSILIASHTEVSISYNKFLGNNLCNLCLLNFNGVLTSIDHSKFINNTGSIPTMSVLCVANTDVTTLHLNEFINK